MEAVDCWKSWSHDLPRHGIYIFFFFCFFFLFLINNILRFQNESDIDLVIQRKREEALKLGLTLQPLIFVVGPNLTEIVTTFVYLDGITFKTDSVLASLQLCFEIFHVFHVNYAAASQRVWTLIQLLLYGFSTIFDVDCVTEIIADVELRRQLLKENGGSTKSSKKRKNKSKKPTKAIVKKRKLEKKSKAISKNSENTCWVVMCIALSILANCNSFLCGNKATKMKRNQTKHKKYQK